MPAARAAAAAAFSQLRASPVRGHGRPQQYGYVAQDPAHQPFSASSRAQQTTGAVDVSFNYYNCLRRLSQLERA